MVSLPSNAIQNTISSGSLRTLTALHNRKRYPSRYGRMFLDKESDMPRWVNMKVNLKVPGIISISGTWEPNQSEIKAAWELYVEMVTRTPLGGFSPHKGSIREALSSIYSLFDTTRGILRQHGPAIARSKSADELSFGYFAVSMLNLVLRPMLTEWHPRLQAWERRNPSLDEHEWPDRCDFWEALDQTAKQLREYAGLFAEVAEVPELIGGSDVESSTP